jgi:glycosyltransferase involved in cell wall biosynthesis
MRIGIVAPPWFPVPPQGYGGIEAVVHTLSLALQRAGHEVVLAASSDSTSLVPMVPGLPESEPEALGLTLTEMRFVSLAYDALGDMDLIHDHTVGGPLYRHRPPGVPIAATVHGPFIPEMLDVYRSAAKDTSIVAISRHHASMATGVEIAAVIHHGLDPGSIPVGTGHGGYACFLGRVHPTKGIVEAILTARDAGIPIKIAAKMREPAEQAYFDLMVRPLLGTDAEYLGELGSAEKHELLGGAVALVNPIQWNEPFGMVMIEALATGTPVIATPRGSAPEIVEDGITGYLGIDHLGLVDALLRAAALDRAACRTAVEGHFSAERMATEHLALYRRMLEGA